LNLDDRLGLAELGRQPLGFSLEPLVFGDQGGVGVGLPPTTLGGQAGQRPFVALLPPGVQVRRVQALAAQQSAELAWFGAAIGLAENAKLVLRREPSPHGLLRDGRVGDRLSVACGRDPQGRGGRGGGRNSSRATPSFRSAHHHLFCSQHPCSLHRSTSLPSTVITKEAVVSPIIGTEGDCIRRVSRGNGSLAAAVYRRSADRSCPITHTSGRDRSEGCPLELDQTVSAGIIIPIELRGLIVILPRTTQLQIAMCVEPVRCRCPWLLPDASAKRPSRIISATLHRG